jgi:hypothetical protein
MLPAVITTLARIWVRSVPRCAASSEERLAVDVNGRYDLETAIAYAKALRQYELF